MATVKQWIITPRFGYSIEVQLPSRREVCHRCNGDGVHVNPSIDGHGISPEDLYEDPDFAESYMRGHYDVRCEECKGNKVVDVLDWDCLSPKMQEAVQKAIDEERATEMEAAAERRWGA